MTNLRNFFGGLPDAEKIPTLDTFRASPDMNIAHAVDAVLDMVDPSKPEDIALLLAVRNLASNFDSERVGHAFFEGLVYTNGNLTVDHELVVNGAVVADGAPGKGNVYLHGGSRVTYLEDLFEPGTNSLIIYGKLQVKTWNE
ncbi:MAG: hypothetical protein AB7S38_12660 [Vulcanimicrobiota bacterium]